MSLISGLVVAASFVAESGVTKLPLLKTPQSARADTPSTLGTSFSFVVPPNLDTASVYAYVSSAESGTGTWSIGGGSATSFNLTANQATSLTIGTGSTANLASPGSSPDTTISGKMIRITTSVPASVYADNNSTYTSDATVIIPDPYLGTEYRALTMKNEFGSMAHSRLSVLAIEDSTTISVTPKTVAGSRSAGTTFTVSLNAGQTYTLSAPTTGQDVTGTKVTSSKPVAVFSSVDCFNGSTYFPYVSRNQSGACDVLFEQVPPVDSWGKNFITNGFADKNNGGTPVKILAKEANTVVSVNGSTVATLGDGEYYEYNYFESASATGTATNSGLYITATKAVLVAVFMKGGGKYGTTDQTGDPAMAYLAPFEQNLNEYTVVSATGNNAQLLNIAIPKSALSSLRIDGSAPSQSSPNSFVDFTANGTVWSLGQIITTTGSHNLTASQAFSVMVYGANSANSYAYTGGQSLAPIALVDSITLQTNSNYAGDVGQKVCIDVNVLDANGAALPGVRVDGSISGINSSTALVDTSNNQGVASLCYESASAGTDTVTLSSNGRSASTQVVWTVVVPDIAYDPNSLSVVSGSAMPTITPTNTGSPVNSWTISPTLPTGLTINSSTGAISGTPTATSSSTNFTITATNTAGTDTAVVALEVTASAVVPTIDYVATYSLTLDQAITTIIPTTSGTYPSWSLSGTLPAGLSFNVQNGQISGTPTRLKSATSYTVTATNAQGSTTDTFSIEVVASQPDISYSPSSANFVTNTAITPMLPSNGGSPATSWTISPSLPAGLSFNSSTGQISGTPTATSAQTTYTVTATNSRGNDTTTVVLSVASALLAPDISYSATSLSLTVGTAITALLPTNVGGAATSWSFSPSLPTGLSFNSSSGRISGTPSVASSLTTYTATATNASGTSTFQISVVVTTPGATTTTASPTTTVTANTSPSSGPVVAATTTTTTTTTTTSATTATPPSSTPVPRRNTTTTAPRRTTTTTSAPRISTTTTSTVVKPVTTVKPVVVTTTSVTPPVSTPTTFNTKESTTTLSQRQIEEKVATSEFNVYDLSVPVFINGSLPNPSTNNPIVIQTGASDPVDVAIINDQALQLSTIAVSLRITVLDLQGNLVPLSPTGAMTISRNNKIVVTGSGWKPETEMVAWMFSSPRQLGTIAVPKSGRYSGNFDLPNGIEPGTHTIQVNGIIEDGSMRSMNVEVILLGETLTLQNEWKMNGNQRPSTWWLLILCATLFVATTTWLALGGRRRRRREGSD